MRLRAASLLLLLAGCGQAPTVQTLGSQPPGFDLIQAFTGHLRSWGVVENRSGEPTGWIVTDCVGSTDSAGTLHVTQHLSRQDGTTQTRDWVARRTGRHDWDATASDMIGHAHGTADGRAFHWRWSLAAGPGKAPVDVTMDQWMYRLDDGSVINRTTVRKLGVILAEVTESFARVP